ncbi:TNF receptor-associated factor 6 [Desmophyllum pertusum]|uniref:TNF receptor-associated factor 6 n=1 Tax=Desmophyllum pertusum TaxID=174260 RepID=A0A9W9YV23_9CNID|nr:TNF receptor-associated factor 6 [Desmophyllum pertusum]
MPGYQLSSPDKERIGAKYMCNSCGLLLRDAMQAVCGHFYCNSCLTNLFLNGTSKLTCLQDKTEFLPNEVFPDNFMRREVQALVVHCTFLDDGCQWKGEVRHLENHTNSCEFLKIPCVHPECGMQVKKADLTEHLEKECKCRLENCGFCKSQVNLNKMKVLTHNPKEKSIWRTEKQLSHHPSSAPPAVRVSKNLESLLMRDPRIASRNPHILTNYGVIADLLSQAQPMQETRDLREKCRENTAKESPLWREKWLLGNCQPVFLHQSPWIQDVCTPLFKWRWHGQRHTHLGVLRCHARGMMRYSLAIQTRRSPSCCCDQDNVEHAIDSFRPDPSSPPSRDQEEKNQHRQWIPMFCSLAELNNHAYMRDDAMFLKIIVDTLICSVQWLQRRDINITIYHMIQVDRSIS